MADVQRETVVVDNPSRDRIIERPERRSIWPILLTIVLVLLVVWLVVRLVGSNGGNVVPKPTINVQTPQQ